MVEECLLLGIDLMAVTRSLGMFAPLVFMALQGALVAVGEDHGELELDVRNPFDVILSR